MRSSDEDFVPEDDMQTDSEQLEFTEYEDHVSKSPPSTNFVENIDLNGERGSEPIQEHYDVTMPKQFDQLFNE